MTESQSKIDAAAEKAFAVAAEKKAAETAAKPVEAARPAPVATPAVPVVAKVAETAPVSTKPVQAPVLKKPVAKKIAAKKVAAPKAAPKKVAVKKAAARKVAARKTAAVTAPAKKPVVAAAKTVEPTTTISQLKDKIMATTKTTDFTAKAKETVADMQTRAKAAYDKGAELTADVAAFHKGNLDAVVEAGKVLAAGVQDMGRTYVEDVKAAAETVTDDVKKMVAVKSPTELFQLQGEIARRNLDTLVAKTSKNAEVMMKLANDMFAPISTRASVAMERFNKAA